eukprot:Nitzschia sp. Nitz4//scaffold46_size129759//105623//106651//NITZ4_003520-RA/size129759-augustus-gene-0.13-mRNA-1//1//CDS//3329552652//8043//frame0
MGNAQPQNKTGRKVVAQKLENATKTGVLSLSEHKLETCPEQIFQIPNLRTLDLSKNEISALGPKFSTLVQLKSLNLEQNKLPAGSLSAIEAMSKLQNLSLGSNRLGKPAVAAASGTTAPPANSAPFPEKLPKGLKQLKLSSNFFSNIPRPILAPNTLLKLEKLDLSMNQLAVVPPEISNLAALTDLNLDNNVIVSLPEELGKLSKLKVLSLKSNHISVSSTQWSDKNPQPLPESIFTQTPMIDLNLHGNPMTSTQLNTMSGYDTFLERRQKVKTSTLLGGGLTNLDVCGLE